MSVVDPHNRGEETLRTTTMGGSAATAGAEVDHEIEVTSVLPGMTEGYEPPVRTQWQLFRRRFFRHKLAVFGLFTLVVLYAAVFTADWWVPLDPRAQDVLKGTTSPGGENWFGTDQLGRDFFAQVIYAGQISLKIGVGVALISTVIGTIMGSLAGFFGRWIDLLLMRVTDLFLIVPGIAVLAIALRKFGTSDTIIIFVLAGLGWMQISRVVRGQVLAVKEKEFVDAARAAGASNFRIITRHILPNCIGPIVVNATLAVAFAIVAESTLSFLGFGVQKPETSWGNLLFDAKGNVQFDTHLLYFPGLFILLTVLCINFVGDGLRDALDPQSGRD
ncbi:MAG TPA: ABC transporter permease [Acidimicrobiales bacterium]|nr:ABC transporter permease [Acidimicrobiales bacterium]